MPLIKSGSRAAISQNISEMVHAAHPRAQAIAAALSTARRYGKGKAFGGGTMMEDSVIRGSMYGLRRAAMIHSTVPGRTDKLPMNVRAGSYILPADIPSAIGQGNSSAGGVILSKMFSSGPYGLPTMHGSSRVRQSRLKFDSGGGAEGDGGNVDIVAAGGEMVVPPEVVRELGHGSLKKGHAVLDAFVLHVRKKHIETLKSLPGPKR